MFEFFRKRSAPSPEEPNKDYSDEPQLSRRGFLKGVAAVGAVAAAERLHLSAAEAGEGKKEKMTLEKWHETRMERMRYHELGELPSREREKLIGNDLEVYRRFVRTSAGQKILQGGDTKKLSLLMRSIPALQSEHIRDTKFDVPLDEWPSVVVDFTFDKHGMPRVYDPRAHNPKDLKSYHCGNGFMVSNRHMATNWHVISDQVHTHQEQLEKRSDSKVGLISSYAEHVATSGVDAVIVEFPHKFDDVPRPPLAFRDMTDKDLEGSYVCTSGFDYDASSEEGGVKRYPSSALKVTKGMLKFLGLNASDKMLLKSFMCILPPGEAKERKDSQGKTYRRAQGMSGSPVMTPEGVVGVIHSVVSFNDPVANVTIDIGFFHGPDVLNALVEENIAYASTRGTQGANNTETTEHVVANGKGNLYE